MRSKTQLATVSSRLRARVRDLLGLSALHKRVAFLESEIHRLETQSLRSADDVDSTTREHWRAASPTTELTWGLQITGRAFVEKADARGAFGDGRTVVEVGPGYGRLLAEVLARSLPFGAWIGVDLSERNVSHLRREFQDPRVRFVHGDAAELRVEDGIDTIISSLTFKLLYPSFEEVLGNLASQLRPGGVVLFDLVEGERRFLEEEGRSYIRWYSRAEVEEILTRVGLKLEAFDEVRHDATAGRLLVVARRPGGSP